MSTANAGGRLPPNIYNTLKIIYNNQKHIGEDTVKILIFDGFSILNRGFYALPLLTNSSGEYTNAIYGFLNIFFRFIDEENPDCITVAFDMPQPTFRHNIYDAYKGTRKTMPDELRSQIPVLKNLLGLMQIPIVEMAGFEADDIIGTLCKKAEQDDYIPVVISGDRDLLQLATDKTMIRIPKTSKGKTEVENYYSKDVQKKYGVTPTAYIDIKALMGDTSDNIPGVPGIGEVTATKIISLYGSLEKAIEHVSEIKPKKAAQNLLEYKEQAFLSKELATIVLDVPIEPEYRAIDITPAFEEIKRLELKTFFKRFYNTNNNIIQSIEHPYTAFVSVDNGILLSNGDFINDLNLIKSWLESDTPKITWDIKSHLKYFKNINGVIFDAMLASYILETLNPCKNIQELADMYLQEHINNPAIILQKVFPILDKKLEENGQKELFEQIEMPLAFVLAEMEEIGIGIDGEVLKSFGKSLDEKIKYLTHNILTLAGEDFNINSPKQLGVILFEKLGLKGGKKTTTGYSTAADVLEKLKSKHEIVPLILEYRAYTKLKSTYIDALLPLIKNSRIYSTFNQALTATGRLSSAEPNLQNIPIRLGRELIKAFIPKEGCVFVDADYSQIELRVLAHIANDNVLIQAFKENQDIHRITASQVLGIPPKEVTPIQRSNAKAVNFGIVYGISAFGLSEDIGIGVKEAENYINSYLEKYTGVKSYMKEIVETSKKTGYVATLYNRRRKIPELKSYNFAQKNFGARVAMNMPIQGTAADIIKIAMINISKRLKGLQSKIVLQVHDELLLEVPKSEVDEVINILRTEMESVASLSVPLVADINIGTNWYETK